ncbi:hypothetical protein V5799_026933 [Amblyomma americanum]|uniref:Uncharacterized protein n=1 Tax=Amblyomma americanum TaxID=6943 RepID=A0AAQ4DH52_AMBAM
MVESVTLVRVSQLECERVVDNVPVSVASLKSMIESIKHVFQIILLVWFIVIYTAMLPKLSTGRCAQLHSEWRNLFDRLVRFCHSSDILD